MSGYWEDRCNNLEITLKILRENKLHKKYTVGYLVGSVGYEFIIPITPSIENVYKEIFHHYSNL